jgi:hypothetical protein
MNELLLDAETGVKKFKKNSESKTNTMRIIIPP